MLFGRAKAFDAALESVRAGEREAIPALFGLYAICGASKKALAARALADALEQMDVLALACLDARMRKSAGLIRLDTQKLSLARLLAPIDDARGARAICVLASFHPDGYLREQAVTRLDNHAQTLPALALRLNDWVEQVRARAQAAFIRRLEIAESDEFARAITLPGFARAPAYTELSDAIRRKAVTNEGASALNQALLTGGINVRRQCFRLLNALEIADDAWRARCLKREKDPFLRAEIFDSICAAGGEVSDIALYFTRDKHPRNRLKALNYLNGIQAASLAARARKMLLDKSARVCELARDITQAIAPDFDARAYYTARLKDNAARALDNLRALGNAADARLAEKYISSACARVARAAMKAAFTLDEAACAPMITGMLADARASVSRAAYALIARSNTIDYARVYEIYGQTARENVKLNCLALLFAAPKWTALIYMLGACQSASPAARALALNAVARWLRRVNISAQPPARDIRLQALTLIEANRAILGEATANMLRFCAR